MARKKRMSAAAVLEWFEDCVNEAEANGYEVAESLQSTGDSPSWYEGEEGFTPTIEWREGGTMMVKMPDGSFVRVEVHRVRNQGEIKVH